MRFFEALDILEKDLKIHLGIVLPNKVGSSCQFTVIMQEFIENVQHTSGNKVIEYVTDDMIKRNRDVLDDWHFAQNINSMMKNGYCRKCGLSHVGCKREGCGE